MRTKVLSRKKRRVKSEPIRIERLTKERTEGMPTGVGDKSIYLGWQMQEQAPELPVEHKKLPGVGDKGEAGGELLKQGERMPVIESRGELEGERLEPMEASVISKKKVKKHQRKAGEL